MKGQKIIFSSYGKKGDIEVERLLHTKVLGGGRGGGVKGKGVARVRLKVRVRENV